MAAISMEKVHSIVRSLFSVPAPSLRISSSGSYYLGTQTNLTCTAVVILEVDQGRNSVIGTFTWLSREGEAIRNDQNFEITSTDLLSSQLQILSLGVNDTNFTCSATIHLGNDPGRVSPSASTSFAATLECEILF